MKKLAILISTLLLIVSMGTAFAQPMKVGTVDLMQIIRSPQAATLKTKLKAQLAPQQKKLMDARTSLRNETMKLRKATKMTPAARKKAQDKIAKKQKDLRTMMTNLQKDAAKARLAATKGFKDTINNTVKQVAKKEGLKLVFVKQAILYAEQTEDITKQVLEALPKK